MYTPFANAVRRPFSPIAIKGSATATKPTVASQKMPSRDLTRVLNFYADYSGCGHWRMIWPELLLRSDQAFNISGGTVMIGDPNFYRGVHKVRIQRQATEAQLKFMNFLINLRSELKQEMDIIYEIDDIIFIEDIPEYNKFRTAFDDENIRKTSKELMLAANEMTVTCNFMKEYFEYKTGHKQITVIPNYVPKFWMDRFYNKTEISKNLDKNRKRPRILYCGSGAHFDVDSRVKHQDDFAHVNDVIRRTVKDFQWVFFGGFPGPLRDLVASGKVEYHSWTSLMEYPYKIHSLKPQIMYAPLQNNNFNKAKSDLKFIEGCCMGIPTICQDIETYSNAFYKFDTGDDLVDQIKSLTRDHQKYTAASKRGRKLADTRWLENNIDVYQELYNFSYGSPERKKINILNNLVVN